jgi:hypothetical protein
MSPIAPKPAMAMDEGSGPGWKLLKVMVPPSMANDWPFEKVLAPVLMIRISLTFPGPMPAAVSGEICQPMVFPLAERSALVMTVAVGATKSYPGLAVAYWTLVPQHLLDLGQLEPGAGIFRYFLQPQMRAVGQDLEVLPSLGSAFRPKLEGQIGTAALEL